jgi:hypothetical protein
MTDNLRLSGHFDIRCSESLLCTDQGSEPEIQGPDKGVLGMPVEMNQDLSKVPIEVLFALLSGPCGTESIEDPIANYDPLADRWVLLLVHAGVHWRRWLLEDSHRRIQVPVLPRG